MRHARTSGASRTSRDPRSATFCLARGLNSLLDVTYYDVTALSNSECSQLSTYQSPEGSLLIVHPHDAGQPIRSSTPWQFVESQLDRSAEKVDAVVVAGVGSSALGSAALARNVADHLDRPVAGIVAGYGVADALSEALGGWFLLGARNALRYGLAKMLHFWAFEDHVRDAQTHQEMERHFAVASVDADQFIYGVPDSAVLLYLLSKLSTHIKLLVGHSKGVLSIEYALEGWLDACRRKGRPIASHLRIVTFGAAIHFPPEFPNVYQFMGQYDCFGMMNSRCGVKCEFVDGSGHSLNSVIPTHLSVHDALRSLHLS